MVALLLSGLIAWLVVGLPDTATLQAAIRGWGPWGPVVFVGAYALLTLLPLPKGVLSAAAGLAFGFTTAATLVYAAALLGAGLAFVIGRALGRDAIERLTGTRIARIDRLLARRGLLTVVGLRLVPLVPFTVINYAAGLSTVRRRDYALGTAIGIVPGTLSYVALGSGIASGQSGLVVAAAAVLVLLSALAARRLMRRRHPDGAPATEDGRSPEPVPPA